MRVPMGRKGYSHWCEGIWYCQFRRFPNGKNYTPRLVLSFSKENQNSIDGALVASCCQQKLPSANKTACLPGWKRKYSKEIWSAQSSYCLLVWRDESIRQTRVRRRRAYESTRSGLGNCKETWPLYTEQLSVQDLHFFLSLTLYLLERWKLLFAALRNGEPIFQET